MTESWPGVMLPLFVGAVLLVVPGWVVARAGGARGLLAVALGPLLTGSAAATGIFLGAYLHLPRGVVELVLGVQVLALLARTGVRVLGQGAAVAHRRVGTPLAAHPSWRPTRSTGRSWPLVAAVVGAGLLILVVAGAGMRGPGEIVQSYDTSFHVAAIDAAVREGKVTPGFVGRVNRFVGPPAFYPPLFHALGAEMATLSGGGAIVGANLAALLWAAVAWPCSVLALVLTLTHRRLPRVLTVVAAAVVPAFPYLLLSAGILWPLLAGLSLLPAAVACLCQVVHGGRDSRVPALVLLLGSLPGLYYAHPSVLLTAVLAGVVIVVTAMVARAVRPGPLGRRAAWLVLAVATGLLAWVGYGVVVTLPSVASMGKFNAPAAEGIGAAWLEVLKLGPSSVVAGIAPSNAAVPLVAGLVLVGAVSALRRARLWWLPVLHLVVGGLYVLAAASDAPWAHRLTIIWYNDRNRLAALLALTAVPLAGLGAATAVRLVRATVARLRPGTLTTLSGRRLVTAVTTLGLVLVAARGLPAARDVVRAGYDGRPGLMLVSEPEERLYASLPAPGDPQARLLGSPLGGASVGAVLAHRRPVFPHFNNKLDPDRALLARRFKDYGRDPAVCAAAQRLHVDYAVEDTDIFMSPEWNAKSYGGLTGLAAAPGLERVGSAGTVSVYRLEPCRTTAGR